MRTFGPTVLVAAAAAIGVAGCSRSKPMDDGLVRDLAAVRAAPTAQFEISPTEAGLSPSPKAPARTAQPTHRPAKQAVAPRTPPRTPVPAPAPRAVVVEAPSVPARTEVIDAPPAQRPARAPAQADEPRRGPYKTEAEIFR